MTILAEINPSYIYCCFTITELQWQTHWVRKSNRKGSLGIATVYGLVCPDIVTR